MEKLIFRCRRLLTQDGVNEITVLDTRLLEPLILQIHINSIVENLSTLLIKTFLRHTPLFILKYI